MVHLLTVVGDAGEWGQIIGAAFPFEEFRQLLITWVEVARQLNVLAKLHGEVVIRPRNRNQIVPAQAGPIQVTDIVDDLLIAVNHKKVHGQSHLCAPDKTSLVLNKIPPRDALKTSGTRRDSTYLKRNLSRNL
jgi:hypothetical protein